MIPHTSFCRKMNIALFFDWIVKPCPGHVWCMLSNEGPNYIAVQLYKVRLFTPNAGAQVCRSGNAEIKLPPMQGLLIHSREHTPWTSSLRPYNRSILSDAVTAALPVAGVRGAGVSRNTASSMSSGQLGGSTEDALVPEADAEARSGWGTGKDAWCACCCCASLSNSACLRPLLLPRTFT